MTPMFEPGVVEALHALGVTGFVVRGSCNNEQEFLQAFSKVTGADEHGSAIESSNPDDFGVTWSQIETKLTELRAAQPLKDLRAERDRRIAATDWWASSDLTMSAERAAYRQALRDITDNYSSLDDVVWPTKPE